MAKTKTFQEMVGGIPFGVNDWGSCQYTEALNMFNRLTALAKRRRPGGADCPTAETVRMRQQGSALSKLGLKVTYKEIVPLKDAWEAFKKEMKDSRANKAIWSVDDRKELKQDLAVEPSVDAMFTICRGQAWDLWSAAPFIAGLLLKDLKVEAPVAPGRGPKFNAMIQEESYRTGLYCWLLYHNGLVKDTDSFNGFDT